MFTKKTIRSFVALMLCAIMVVGVLPVFASSRLDAPKLKSAKAKDEGIRISWSSVEGAVSYKVYRKTKGTDWEKIATVEKTSYLDKTAKSGKTYTYTVKAVDADGNNSKYDHDGISGKWKKAEAEKVKEEKPAVEPAAESEDTEDVEEEATANAPSKPALKALKYTAKGVVVRWDTVAGAVKYRILRKTSEKGKWKTIKTIDDPSATSYEDTKASSGTTYWYSVRGVDAAGNKGKYDNTGKKITFYAAPTLKSVKSVENGIQIKWNAVSGAPAYWVLRNNGGKWKKIAVTKDTFYTDKSIALGTTYQYSVRVCSSNYKKKLSEYDHTGLSGTYVGHAAVSSLKPHDGYTSKTTGVHHDAFVRVEWDAVPGAAQYRVYHKTGDGKWIKLGDTAATSFDDYTVVNDTTYIYRIRALDAGGNYVGSYDKSGKSITYYSAPTLTECVRSGEALLTTWEPVEGVTHYEVRRKIVAGGTWKTVAIVNTTSYSDTSMPSGTRCWYTVRCCESDGTVISGGDPTGVDYTSYMDMPILVSAVQANGGVTFTWKPVDKAVNYHIYRKNGERSAWVSLGTSTTTTYNDTTAMNGTTYYYTVATRDAGDTEDLSLYNETGVSVTYYRQPDLKDLVNTTTGAKLTWGKVDGIGTYKVYRKTGNTDWTVIGTANDTFYTDANVVSTGHYWYTVCCVLNGSEVSSYDTAGLDTTFFWNPPIKSGPTLGVDNISFSWEEVDGINTYKVQRQIEGEADFTTIDFVTGTSYKDYPAATTSGKKITYRVCCEDGAKVSGYSTLSSKYYLVAPAVALDNTTSKQMKLTWNKSKGASGYEIYRKRAGGSWSKVKTITSGGKTSYTDEKLDSGYTYYYYIVATSGSGNSANGPEANAMVN